MAEKLWGISRSNCCHLSSSKGNSSGNNAYCNNVCKSNNNNSAAAPVKTLHTKQTAIQTVFSEILKDSLAWTTTTLA